jgi:hypothetical protein
MMVAASLAVLLTAALHTVAHFSPLPDDPQLNAAVAVMQECRVDAGFGMQPTVEDITRATSLAMTVFLGVIAVANLVVVGNPSCTTSLVRRLAVVNAASMAALAAVF